MVGDEMTKRRKARTEAQGGDQVASAAPAPTTEKRPYRRSQPVVEVKRPRCPACGSQGHRVVASKRENIVSYLECTSCLRRYRAIDVSD